MRLYSNYLLNKFKNYAFLVLSLVSANAVISFRSNFTGFLTPIEEIAYLIYMLLILLLLLKPYKAVWHGYFYSLFVFGPNIYKEAFKKTKQATLMLSVVQRQLDG